MLELNDCKLDVFNGEADHVHAIISLHPAIEPAKLINTLKTVTSRLARKRFQSHLKTFYWGVNALWSRSYYLVSVGGAPIETLKTYIESQDGPKPVLSIQH